MSALEQEIYEKFQQLDDEAKQRVLQALEQQSNIAGKGDWLGTVRALRAEMSAKYGKLAFSTAALIDEVREERLNDLMDRY